MYALSNYIFVQNILEHTFWEVVEMLQNVVKKGHFFFVQKKDILSILQKTSWMLPE